MTQSIITQNLINHGWTSYSGKSVTRCQRGDAQLSFYLVNGEMCISIPNGSWSFLKDVKWIDFTPYRILVRMKEYREWYLQY